MVEGAQGFSTERNGLQMFMKALLLTCVCAGMVLSPNNLHKHMHCSEALSSNYEESVCESHLRCRSKHGDMQWLQLPLLIGILTSSVVCLRRPPSLPMAPFLLTAHTAKERVAKNDEKKSNPTGKKAHLCCSLLVLDGSCARLWDTGAGNEEGNAMSADAFVAVRVVKKTTTKKKTVESRLCLGSSSMHRWCLCKPNLHDLLFSAGS